MTTHDNDEAHNTHVDWTSDRRPCVFCTVLDCGCPHEPTIGEHIHLGQE